MGATGRRRGAVSPRVATRTTAPATATDVAQPDHRLRRGGARPAPRQPGELADPPQGAAGRPRRRARCGRLGPAGPRQPAPGFVVDGHARVALALSRGEATVPVLYVDLEPDEEALVLATLDPIGAMAGRDEEKLRALLADVTVDDAGLLALLGDLAGSDPKAGLTDPDEVPEPPRSPTSSRASSTCSATTGSCAATRRVQRTSAAPRRRGPTAAGRPTRPTGSSWTRTWRDGVYNGPRKRATGWGERGRRREAVHDARDPTAKGRRRARAPNRGPSQHHGRLDTRADWSGAFALVPRLEVGYVWHAASDTAWRFGGTARHRLRAGRQKIVWVKDLWRWAVLLPLAATNRASTSWAPGSAHRVGRRARPDDGLGGPARSDRGGGEERRRTTRPRSRSLLVEIPIRNHSPRRGVYEPFSGSGTTLIAAEQLGRRCYAMEIDPKYVQVAIERWQNFTGRTAERVDG